MEVAQALFLCPDVLLDPCCGALGRVMTALCLPRVLDVPFGTPPRSSLRAPCPPAAQRPSLRDPTKHPGTVGFATKCVEICGHASPLFRL